MSKNDQSRDMLFAAFYVGKARFDATRAAELAGIEAKNRHSLNTTASYILRKPHVQEFIREHVRDAQITQEQILIEMAKLAFWDHEKNKPSCVTEFEDGIVLNPNSMAEVKYFDAMMRGKLKCLSDLSRTFDNDTAKEIAKVRKAIEQHREEYPTLSATERSDLFTNAGVDPKMVKQVMDDLLKSDENRKRMAEIEEDERQETRDRETHG